MRVSKWGNSLAVRIPAEIVEELGLKEGDEVSFKRTGPNKIVIETPMSAEDRIKWLHANTQIKSTGWKFNRDELYDDSGRS
jgi:antitoxin MazE